MPTTERWTGNTHGLMRKRDDLSRMLARMLARMFARMFAGPFERPPTAVDLAVHVGCIPPQGLTGRRDCNFPPDY